jgi:cytochrome c oxidase subunit 2
VAVAIIEAVLLLVYAIPAWATRVAAFPSETEAVVVRVTGEQFAWNIHYPGMDGRFGRRNIDRITPDNLIGLDRTDPDAKDDIVTTNQMNLPVNRPVLIHLSTKDVIHSFGSVEMRVKQDAIPGLETPVWFIPNKLGDYEISCSQLCGLGHFRMKAFMSVKSEADFQTWLAEESKGMTR